MNYTLLSFINRRELKVTDAAAFFLVHSVPLPPPWQAMTPLFFEFDDSFLVF